jgi:hypothetical protein
MVVSVGVRLEMGYCWPVWETLLGWLLVKMICEGGLKMGKSRGKGGAAGLCEQGKGVFRPPLFSLNFFYRRCERLLG